MSEQWGRPELPPRPKRKPSDLASHFVAYLDRAYIKLNRRAEMTVTFTVPAEEKWKALLLDNAEGFMVGVEVYKVTVDEMTESDLAAKLGLA